jgi:hypothetical protein
MKKDFLTLPYHKNNQLSTKIYYFCYNFTTQDTNGNDLTENTLFLKASKKKEFQKNFGFLERF